jgi:aminopeptidase N
VQFDKDDIFEDGSNDDIVSHELFHHWFGDLVTCESWANLTLNEGFANYAEYLWKEYKYGRERADISRLNELSSYFDQAMYDAHPLIHYHYGNEDQMFDAHSYNKGGLVLHMLRDLVGDDAFFASLRTYLRQHAYASAEVHDLRLAFEATTVKDLNWFFDQWYFEKGHPVLDIQNTYNATSKMLTIDFSQSQDTLGFYPVFTLPIEIAIYHSADSVEYQHVLVNQQQQSFSYYATSPPQAVVVDPRDILLAVIHHDIPPSEYAIRALSDLSINHRISALRLMEEIEPEDMMKLMADTSLMMRVMMISRLADQRDINRLVAISKIEHREIILYFILETLLNLDPLQTKDISLRLLEFSSKPPIVAGALLALADVDLDEAIHQLAHVKNDAAPAIFIAKASIYARKGNQVSLDFFTTPFAATIREEYLEHFIKAMALFLSTETPDIQDQGLAYINSDFYLKTPDPKYRRYYLITGLLEQYSNEVDINFQNKILNTIRSLYKKETNEYLKGVLKDGLGELLD